MSINISIVRNVMDDFLDCEGNSCELAVIINRGIDSNLIIKGISKDFKNDYEFMLALKNAVIEVKNNPKFNKDADLEMIKRLELDKELTMSANCQELLKNSSAVSDFAKKTYFALNNNLVRFEIGNGSSAVAFVKNGDCELSQHFNCKLIDALPDMCLAYNIHKQSMEIKKIKNDKIDKFDVIGYERQKKLKTLCSTCEQLSKEYILRAKEKDLLPDKYS